MRALMSALAIFLLAVLALAWIKGGIQAALWCLIMFAGMAVLILLVRWASQY